MPKIIGIYGLAANPPTLGHTHVIKSVLDANIVDEIWVVPTYVHFHGKNMVPYEIRCEMCDRAFLKDAKFPKDIVKVMRIENAIATLEPDYDGSTTSMLENLRKHQNHDYRIIIGQDNADSMKTWKNGESLIQKERFIVLPRPKPINVNALDNIVPITQGGFRHGELNVFMSGEAPWYNRPWHTVLRDIEMLDISSTMVRSMCAREDETGINWEELESVVSDWVITSIKEYRLYKEGN